jgi:hypothetical protein
LASLPVDVAEAFAVLPFIYMVQQNSSPLAMLVALDAVDAHDAGRLTFGIRSAASAPRSAVSA